MKVRDLGQPLDESERFRSAMDESERFRSAMDESRPLDESERLR